MIKIENKIISNDSPTFIIAEVGANHNGDLELAKKSIDAAVECGVDAVKFQTYTTKELLSNEEGIIGYGKEDNITRETLKELFDRISLKRAFHKEIYDYANSKGLICFSTPFSVEGVAFLEELDNPIYKIASSDVNYVDMLEVIGVTKKPVFLSTGKCTLSEMDMAIDLLYKSGTTDLCLLHCIANYPSKMENMNLNVIKTLKQMYPECIIGFSDHSLGITASLGAVCFGAKIIEKHFTIDKNLEGPDHWFSMDPTDMKNLVNGIRDLEIAFGTQKKMLNLCEEPDKYWATRSLHINKDLKAGDIIKREDLDMLRPGYGISPFDKDKVIGIKLAKDMEKGTVLEWTHLQSK
ncbi:N-acetylneuraminate synthase family protein [Aliarcobacter butzleri]|uniref:N-acetylneuraminate synthase family protein n=1 Tax=Aliarcobacter butzleri TaxID=28197 RepID=UPI0012609227|nr:N-acetylneuraminate synthase family protein [Aliarcobacter butzleri]MDN5078307.1 N-acetylneuraminate synthase family protein [Aliarcobacter butzleri]MDN5119668.1 N-acetylneuraminate synthase family protein [Aliarcobacter butzleri]